MKLAIVLLALSSISLAADTKPSTPPPVPDIVKQRLLSAYRLALLRQSEAQKIQQQLCDATPQCKEAVVRLNSAIADYNSLIPSAVKEAGLAEGSTFTVDSDKGDVTAVAPPPPPTPQRRATDPK